MSGPLVRRLLAEFTGTGLLVSTGTFPTRPDSTSKQSAPSATRSASASNPC
ncbi:MAG TPA: hypothetical protein VHY58_05345 [Streptosporangiaceae bacterium]|jgi:hypothetical protein|nr:hypothetical protein [Streptosporangiaceae bacterium]